MVVENGEGRSKLKVGSTWTEVPKYKKVGMPYGV